MAQFRCLWIVSVACLFMSGCNKHPAKKPDPTKGVVTGIVLCADTGKPARFATVTLTASPKKDEKIDRDDPLPAAESTVTDLDGRFRLEAVEPGHYFAFATLDGYLDPAIGLDPARIRAVSTFWGQRLDSIDQWKDHLTEVSVHVHRVSEVTLQIERGAEIGGTVTFDDGSPAIGMHFQLSRKTEKGSWTDVGLSLLDSWSIHTVSDGHGRFNITGLPAGEYTVCALMPADSQDAAPRICLGNTFRKKDAATVKVHAGEAFSGADINIPLSGLHNVAGTVSALADGHPLASATLRLLYSDDREKARESMLLEDGSFSFEYVAEGKYILQVSGAKDARQGDSAPAPADSNAGGAKAKGTPLYANKEVPITVLDDVDDIQVNLSTTPPDKPREP